MQKKREEHYLCSSDLINSSKWNIRNCVKLLCSFAAASSSFRFNSIGNLKVITASPGLNFILFLPCLILAVKKFSVNILELLDTFGRIVLELVQNQKQIGLNGSEILMKGEKYGK